MRQRTETLAEPQLRVKTVSAESQVADGRKGQDKHRPSDEPEHAGEQFRLFKSEHQSAVMMAFSRGGRPLGRPASP